MFPLLPALLLGGSFWYLNEEKKREAISAQPVFTPGALAEISEMRDRVRFVRESVKEHVSQLLAASALEPVEVEGGQVPGHLFRLVPLVPGAISAAATLEMAREQRLVAIASLSLLLVGAKEDRLLWFVPEAFRAIAGAASQFAVLQDVTPLPVVEAKPKAKRVRKPRPKKTVTVVEVAHVNGVSNGHAPVEPETVSTASPSSEE